MLIHYDCRFFEGSIPCKFNKLEGVHCQDCPHYSQVLQRILIIQLGALGDVIRSTPLLERLKVDYPHSQIFWLTHSPDFLPATVDKKLLFNLQSLVYLDQLEFDILINLDKDPEACALVPRFKAKQIYGFTLKEGVPAPANRLAEHKFITGIFDEESRRNTKSYPQELFELCGYTFNGERYAMELDEGDQAWSLPGDSALVGLNTGCGKRWPTRLWPENRWRELANQLLETDYRVLLLGGDAEHQKNLRIQAATGAFYKGAFPLGRFFSLLNQCDLIVTTVTMALHVAIALQKKIVLLNNIFNRSEFELYGLGQVLEPPNCTCYYAITCDKGCMQELDSAEVLTGVTSLLPAK